VFQFHEFLERCRYSPRSTRLLRHDARGGLAWRRGQDAFLCFASFQTQANSPYNGAPSHACHFIPGPTIAGTATALFIGTTEVENGRPWDREELPIIQDEEVINQELASLAPLDLFDLSWCGPCSTYVERILIDWGPGTRSWSQWADRRHKSILELRLDARRAKRQLRFSDRCGHCPSGHEAAVRPVKVDSVRGYDGYMPPLTHCLDFRSGNCP
jgi:hypothetical protein